jgi:peptidoglycan-associated lipoprotein
MQKVLVVSVAALLLVIGCSKKPARTDDFGAADPFNVGEFDPAALGSSDMYADYGDSYAGDLPIASGMGNMRFGEPGSGMLDPAIDAEAKMVFRDVHFAYDSAAILPNEAGILQQIAAFLKRYPQVIIEIEGHCDERGTEEYNMALGSRRANAVRQFLADLGVDPNRLFTISYGEMRPLNPGHDENAWAQNRRGHFLVGQVGR